MKKYAVILLLSSTSHIYADVPSEQQHEVQHLMNFVKSSACQIVRNGSAHNAADALEHIQKKYDYFKGDISTSEEFIDYSATKSTMTGWYYFVECKGKERVKTKDWLLQELQRYRIKQETPATS
ncbi:MAG: hypothetical protein GQ582_03210 [Methyloprofundus sp.]|nr:hypothetical protein [Methyloprofundus sp.]